MDAKQTEWHPAAEISRADVLARSERILAMTDIDVAESEDIFRIRALDLDWDMGLRLYAPKDASRIAVGADGKKIGVFILHGGSGDFKSMEAVSSVFAKKLGCKVMSMTFPGRLYLDNASRDWPGDTIRDDGSVRTPIWKLGEHISSDQYEVVRDVSMRMRYGTRTVARAKPGTVSTIGWRRGLWPSRKA